MISRSQILQQIENNIPYGENSRDHNADKHLTSSVTFVPKAINLQASYTQPNPQKVLGADISHWDGLVDFTNSYERGMRYVFIKATDGTVPSKWWAENRPNAVRNGLLTGDYTWLYPHRYVSAVAQAQAFWTRISGKTVTRQLPPVVDFEWTNYAGKPANPDYSDLDIFLTELNKIGEKPILYTAAGYANMFGPIPQYIKNKIRGLWIANYGVATPAMPIGVSEWMFWQFTNNLSQDFYMPSSTGKKTLDGNYFASSIDELKKLAGETVLTPPPVEPPILISEEKSSVVIIDELNLRSGAGTQFSVIGSLYKGDKVFGKLDTVTGWLNIGRIIRKSAGKEEFVNGWCSGSYLHVFTTDLYSTPDIFTTPVDGIKQYKIRHRAHTDVYVLIVDMRKVKTSLITNPKDTLKTPTQVAKDYDAELVTNMDAWNKTKRPWLPEKFAASQGTIYQNVRDASPYLNITKDNKVSILNSNYDSAYNAASGFRYVVRNYTPMAYLTGSDVQYTDRHNRRGMGIIDENTLIIIKSDGRSSESMGLTLMELADIFCKYGTQTAYDNDSGGSANISLNGSLLGKLSEPERPVVNHLVLSFKGGNSMGDKLKLTSSDPSKTRTLRFSAPTGQPHIYGAYAGEISLGSYAMADAVSFYEYPQDVYVAGALRAKAGDIWYRVYEVNGKLTSGDVWVAGIHLGVKQLNVTVIPDTVNPPPPPPPTTPPTSEVEIIVRTDGVVVSHTKIKGTIEKIV